MTHPHPTLAQLKPGERATIASISTRCPIEERRRLMELGFFPGIAVEATLSSPLGDPVAYVVREMTVALRREQAELIEVERAS